MTSSAICASRARMPSWWCFTEQAPRQASFAAAVKQAQALLEVAMGR